MGRLALVSLSALALVACSALDTADQAWIAARQAAQACYDAPSMARLFPSSAFYVATGQCDSAFASALEAIDWPNTQLGQEAQALENDALSSAATEASGYVPSVSQSQQYMNDRLTLDDDIANEVVTEGH